VIDTILLIAALICFVAAAINVKLGSLNLIGAGLALFVLASLI
jgi:hypothetical protein